MDYQFYCVKKVSELVKDSELPIRCTKCQESLLWFSVYFAIHIKILHVKIVSTQYFVYDIHCLKRFNQIFLFFFKVIVNDKKFQGEGRSKKLAKARAAQMALKECFNVEFETQAGRLCTVFDSQLTVCETCYQAVMSLATKLLLSLVAHSLIENYIFTRKVI